MNILLTTFIRNEKKVKTKHLKFKLVTDGVLWSSICPRQKWSKISPLLLEQLHEQVTHHPYVHCYPLYKDMLWWKKYDGTKEQIAKLLINISIRELHNYMMRSQKDGGLPGVRDPVGNLIISDTTLKDNLTFNMKPIQERHKQVCGCETCIIMEAYQRLLC